MRNKFSNKPWQIWIIILIIFAIIPSGCDALRSEENNKSLRAENDNLRVENDDLKGRVEQEQRSQKEGMDKLEDLRTELDKEQKNREDTQKELEDLRIKFDKEQKNREDTQKELEDLRTELDKKQKNLESTQNKSKTEIEKSSINNQQFSNFDNCKVHRVTRQYGLYLYTAENAGRPILTTLPFNTKVSIAKENSNGWAKVKYLRLDKKIGEGWVAKRFCRSIASPIHLREKNYAHFEQILIS